MSQQLHTELKKEFQLERMIFFSDAVFAIAITLLIIDIKVPNLGNRHVVTDRQLLDALGELIPKIIGFLISFFIIGLYWTIHHRIFGYVINYTRKLLWINLFFLLAVVIMPFSTSFYSEYVTGLPNTPVIIYAGNIVFLGIMNLILWKYLINPKNNLVEGITKEDKSYFNYRTITVPITFIFMATVYLTVSKKYGLWIPLLIPIIMRLIRKFYLKRKK